MGNYRSGTLGLLICGGLFGIAGCSDHSESSSKYAETAVAHHESREEAGILPDFAMAHPEADRAEAYRFQEAFTQAFVDGGDAVIGYKLGFTGKAAPPGAEAPLLGRLLASQRLPDDAPIHLSELDNPILEVELAFRFDQDVSSNASPDQIREAVGAVAACIELPDPHYLEQSHFHGLNFIAHNVVARKFMLFDWKPLDEVGDLGALEPVLTRPDGRNVIFASGNVLPETGRHHWAALEFAVEELARYAGGMEIKAGDIIITGSMGYALSLETDDSGDAPEDTIHLIMPGTYSVDYGPVLGTHDFTLEP